MAGNLAQQCAQGRLLSRACKVADIIEGYGPGNLMTDYDSPGANNDATHKYGASVLGVEKTVLGVRRRRK